MARAREIQKRIGAVKTIQRITKTMQMIATAKFTTALQRAKATRPFTDKIHQLVGEALAATSDFAHPLIDGPAESPKRERVLVITSNRGLCGAYNANVLRTANGEARAIRGQGRELDLDTVGKKAAGYFKFQGIAIAERYSMPDAPDYGQVEQLGDGYIQHFVEGRYDRITVASMRYVSNAKQVPEVLQLLPLAPAPHEGVAQAEPLYDFSPSTESLLDELLPLAVKVMLFQATLDGAVSEQIMRMVAMKAATENAKDLGKTLTRKFNRARQTQITTELMEVVGGAAALD